MISLFNRKPKLKYRLVPNSRGGYDLQKHFGFWYGYMFERSVNTIEQGDKIIAHMEQDVIYYREMNS